MKILFFSDVHGSPTALEKLDKFVKQINPDLLCLLGDALYHGPRNALYSDYAPPAAVAILNSWREKIVAVRGNCDAEVDQMLLEFPIMSDYSTLLVNEQRFFLTHGHLWSAENAPHLTHGTIFCSGHTHLPRLEKLRNGLIAFNPGSITLPKNNNPPSFGLWNKNCLEIRNLLDGNAITSMSVN
ncbi:MAG: phosphodiesterase [Victivallaceae bacterium]